MIADTNSKIIGITTDGDIRRGLLSGISLDDNILTCSNSNFITATQDTSRESLIKLLDTKIKFIPIIDSDGKLISIATMDNLPLRVEQSIFIRSRAPVRVSFGGGGSDLTHYFAQNAGAVVNAAIDLYSHATLKVRDDLKIHIHSLDLNDSIKKDTLNQALEKMDNFGLIQSLLKVIEPKFGFDLYINSDFPIGSGLGGSATVCAAILGCFNMLRSDKWNKHELSEIAFEAERLHLGIAGGWQDQYAAVFGGFNFIEFGMDQNIVNPLRINPDTLLELEECLILCNTGILHNSGSIHTEQKKSMTSKTIQKIVKMNVELAYKTKNLLLRGELDEFGRSLDQAWKFKRSFSNIISSKKLDSIYDGAISNGAIGGKLLGAGGGGFFIFYVPAFKKHKLIKFLEKKKLIIQPFKFELEGVKSWVSRDYNSLNPNKES